jgi:SAM-dependent methyltransferase
MPIYKCEICGKVHRTEDDVCCQSDQLAEPKPGGVSADGDGSLSCAPQATTGNEVNRPFPPVLDACCGSRMFWFNKKDSRAIYADRRKETHIHRQKSRPNPHVLEINPDVVCDFASLPFADETFSCVILDPPHRVAKSCTGNLLKAYGALNGEWRENLRLGFAECFRVLKPCGTLVFKWCDSDVPLQEVLALTPEKPLIGNRKPATSKTHWILFIKSESEPCADCEGLGFIQATDAMVVNRISDGAEVVVDGLPLMCGRCGGKGWVSKSNPSHHDGAASAPSVDGVVGSLNQEG